MKSLAGSLADGMLADTNLIPPHPPIPLTQIMKGSSPRKSTEIVTQKPFTSKWEKEM